LDVGSTQVSYSPLFYFFYVVSLFLPELDDAVDINKMLDWTKGLIDRLGGSPSVAQSSRDEERPAASHLVG
jgi:hypothetical protein